MAKLAAKIEWLNDGFAPFFAKVQSHHVFDFCLNYVNRADETVISSFAINEGFVRRLVKNREKLGHVVVLWDTTMATHNPKILYFLDKNVDEIRLVSNHSKTIWMKGQKEVVAVSSVNTTGNYRYEAGLITRDTELVQFYTHNIQNIINESPLWTPVKI